MLSSKKKSKKEVLLFYVCGIPTSTFHHSKNGIKMIIYIVVNPSKLRCRKEMEFRSRSDLSELHISFQSRNPPKIE